MSKRYDIAGERFGRLTAIDKAGVDKNGSVIWNVECDCGNTGVVSGYNLRKGITKSCGCLRSEVLAEHNLKLMNLASPVEKHYKEYMHSADVRGLDFNLDIEDFESLLASNCYYCNATPNQKWVSSNGSYLYNGIDRYNNDRGYVNGNVVSCCSRCNYFKGSMDGDDFLELIETIHNNRRVE